MKIEDQSTVYLCKDIPCAEITEYLYRVAVEENQEYTQVPVSGNFSCRFLKKRSAAPS